MKEMMTKVIAFLTFEQLETKNQIAVRFQQLCTTFQCESASYNLISVRRELIYEYWYNHVINHFCALFMITVGVSGIIAGKLNFSAIVIAGLISFSGFYMFYYRFVFNHIIIPNLEILKQQFEHSNTSYPNKCKQSQLSNFTLVLIYYIQHITSEYSKPLSSSDEYAAVLNKLYGVDTGSLKKNIDLLLLPCKRKHLTERQKTELRNRFNEAASFYEQIDYKKGLQVLKQAEMKFFIE